MKQGKNSSDVIFPTTISCLPSYRRFKTFSQHLLAQLSFLKNTRSPLSLSHTHVPYPQLLQATLTFFRTQQNTQQKTAQFFKKRLSYTVSIQKDKKLHRFICPYRLHPQAVLLCKGAVFTTPAR
jgi:hypothetical protein